VGHARRRVATFAGLAEVRPPPGDLRRLRADARPGAWVLLCRGGSTRPRWSSRLAAQAEQGRATAEFRPRSAADQQARTDALLT